MSLDVLWLEEPDTIDKSPEQIRRLDKRLILGLESGVQGLFARVS